jgi:hypothetical protein
MSFDLTVYTPDFPPDLKARWESLLLDAGLRCEFPPGFHPDTWDGGCLPVKLEVIPGSFRNADRFGSAPFIASFDFDVCRFEGVEESEVPKKVAAVLKQAHWESWLRTAAGRTVADLRLQSFAAAALAVVTGGVVYDPQQGQFFTGGEALTNAAEEAEMYEANQAGPYGWEGPHWPGWPALGSGPA